MIVRGATVCRGCNAEVEYGLPLIIYVVVAISSAALEYKISRIASGELAFVAWCVGIGAFVTGAIILRKIFRHRVFFKRFPRHKKSDTRH